MARSKMKPSNNTIYSNESRANVLGVDVRFNNRIFDQANNLFVNQTFVASRPYSEKGYKKGSTITVEVRFDDSCKNGHQSFAITGHIQEPGARDWAMCGCIHDDIAKYFPEFAPLIKWHLFDTSGPMHYVANAVYHASNRDYNGYEAGEPCMWDRVIRFGAFPITRKIGKRFAEWLDGRVKFHSTGAKAFDYASLEWLPVAVQHDKKPGDTYDFAPKYTFNGFECKWHECPFDSLTEAQQYAQALQLGFSFEMVPTGYSKGKERDLKAARSVAVWPDATDEQLCAPSDELKAALLERLPGLVAEFKAAMQSINMEWREMPEGE